MSSPLATAWWWTGWALTAAAVVVFRAGLPVWRNLRHRLVVDSVVDEGPGVASVHITGRDLDRLPARAGQFFLWRFLDGEGRSRAHPYSLSATPDPSLLAYGTQEGTVSIDRQLVRVPVDTAALADLAGSTDGQAYSAASGDELERVYADIGSAVGTTTEEREIGSVFAGLALVAAVGAGASSLAWSPRSL